MSLSVLIAGGPGRNHHRGSNGLTHRGFALNISHLIATIPGKVIDTTITHYRIIAKFGGGRIGVVYKAEDTPLKRLDVDPRAE